MCNFNKNLFIAQYIKCWHQCEFYITVVSSSLNWSISWCDQMEKNIYWYAPGLFSNNNFTLKQCRRHILTAFKVILYVKNKSNFMCHRCAQSSYKTYTVHSRYPVASFLQIIHRRHPIACPEGWGMGCLLWIHCLNKDLVFSLPILFNIMIYSTVIYREFI